MSGRGVIALVLLGASGLWGVSPDARRPSEAGAVELRPQQAASLVRAMQAEILEAQKRVIAKFMGLAEADDIRIHFEKNFYGWSVSEKSRITRRDEFETAMAAYAKDFKDDALVDELRIYAKRLQKTSQEALGPMEVRLGNVQKELRDGKYVREGKPVEFTDATRRTWMGLTKLIPLELEFQKEVAAIAGRYTAKITGLIL